MSTRNFSFVQEDTTTLYDALQGYSAESLAKAMLGRSKAETDDMPLDPNVLRLATRRVASLLRALFKLGPNCEASAHVVLPWKPSHLALLSNMSWSDALGTRMVMPSCASRAAQTRFLADALLCISYV